jgi:hypothetical protein
VIPANSAALLASETICKRQAISKSHVISQSYIAPDGLYLDLHVNMPATSDVTSSERSESLRDRAKRLLSAYGFTNHPRSTGELSKSICMPSQLASTSLYDRTVFFHQPPAIAALS